MSVKLLESMRDIYATKLVSWQLEGKDEAIKCCLSAIDIIENGTWVYKKATKEISIKVKAILVPEKFVDTEVDNWIKGYITANEYRILRKQDYQEYLDNEGKKHRLNTKVYYIYR